MKPEIMMMKKKDHLSIIKNVYFLVTIVLLTCIMIFSISSIKEINKKNINLIMNDYHQASRENAVHIIKEIGIMQKWLRDKQILHDNKNENVIHIGSSAHDRLKNLINNVTSNINTLQKIYIQFPEERTNIMHDNLINQAKVTFKNIEILIEEHHYNPANIDDALRPLNMIAHQLQRWHDIKYKNLRNNEAKNDKDRHQLTLVLIISMITIGSVLVGRLINQIRTSLNQQESIRQSLHESEIQVRLLLDSTGEAIFGVDLEDCCTFANISSTRMLGYKNLKDIVGKSVQDIFHINHTSNKYTDNDNHLAEVYRHGERLHSVDFQLTNSKGVHFDIECWSYPILKADVCIGSVVTFIDISERKTIESKLYRSQDILRIAQSIAHIGSWSWNIETGKLDWSNEIFRIFGDNENSFEPTYKKFLARIHPDDIDLVTTSINASIADPEKKYDIEHRIIRPDGEERTVHESGEINYDSEGKPVRMIGTIHDITERKQHVNEIMNLNNQLEQRVAERTIELQMANDQLLRSLERLQQTQQQLVESEKMASLGGLVAGVAHEINTPIGVGVTSASHLSLEIKRYFTLYTEDQMTRGDFEELLNTASESSSLILTNMQRAANLIRSFKQVAVDQTRGQERLFHVKQYFEEISHSLYPKLKKQNHSIVINCPDKLEIYSHPGAFSQLITNLVVNSILHGFEEKNNGEIIIDVEMHNEELSICYRDSGKGISSDHLKKIYDPFFTTKRNHGGSGLGMHIVYNLVTQKLGGKITCTSTPDHGVCFEIKMPHVNTSDRLCA